MPDGLNVSGQVGELLPVWQSPYHPVVQALIWIVAILLSLETVIGNAMVVVAYKLERSISKQISNRYIVSLAVSDLIIGLEGIPLFTVYVINGDRWPLGSGACNTWLFLDYTLCLVSILTVLLITADRYMSVCHTARYLKWQSPSKTQGLIFLSWLISALIFGVMIYLWPFFLDEAERPAEDQCYAPFLANPFVNMSMYIVYYWSTLVAMLILYKGIHKAAKNLEKKAKAKEHRHIALLLTQRLGTQVGVSLMLQSKRADSLKNEVKDSGYGTNNLSTQAADQAETSAFHGGEERNPHLAKLRKEPLSLKRSISPAFSFRKRSAKFRSSIRSLKSIRSVSSVQKPSTVALLDHNNVPTMTVTNHTNVGSQSAKGTAKSSFEERRSVNLLRENTTTIESLSTLFHDESLSSIFQFNPPTILESPVDPTASDTTSIILSRRLSHRSGQTTSMLSISKSEEWRPMENVVPLAAGETAETPLDQPNGAHSLALATRSHEKHSLSRSRELHAPQQKRWLFGNSLRSGFNRLRRRSRKRSGGSTSRNKKKFSRSMSTSSRFVRGACAV